MTVPERQRETRGTARERQRERGREREDDEERGRRTERKDAVDGKTI